MVVREDPKKVIEALISANKIGKKLNLDENYFQEKSILKNEESKIYQDQSYLEDIR